MTKQPHGYINLIKSFVPIKANQLWCSDLSYIKFLDRFWYLATIEDIFTRQIVGVNFGKYHNSELVLQTVKQAILNTKQTPGTFHSDQGTEFMAKT
ncbi:DDE-type integrase/transposase/recombinase [Candidatus Daviesbacteria bacterium]|nr:DDE-type integrase/transposase/recombinase [Candidatus Daviesbacteria bacterium]